ncbi:MAG: hypothetical protein GX758_04415 [Tenericutes bacterium]|nr:hypothetical protein [Mycoplasmatota bacterium]
MKLFKKIFIFVIVLLVLLTLLAYIDYFLVKTNGKLPIISLKKEFEEKDVVVYNALFYKVWYCKTDKTITIGSYSDVDVICSLPYDFEDGYYTNTSGIKISEKDIYMITYKNLYTKEMIDMMKSKSNVDDALYVSNMYFGSKYEKISNINDKVSLVVFPEFGLNGNVYEYIYNKEDEHNYYCMKNESNENETMFSKYLDGKCSDDYNYMKMDSKWCLLYKNSTLVNNPDLVKGLCEE